MASTDALYSWHGIETCSTERSHVLGNKLIYCFGFMLEMHFICPLY